MKILLPLAALAAGFLSAPTVYAQTASRTIEVRDLRLDTAKGVARLDRRVYLAARDVCAAPAAYERAQRRLVAECVAETVTAVMPQRSALLAGVKPVGGIEMSAR